MRLQDLSPEDQRIVQTNFGPDFEKAAAEKVALAQEMYSHGYQLGLDIVGQMIEKSASEEKEEKDDHDGDDHKMDEESEKSAAELGALIAKGTIDALLEKGAEAGDANLFLEPYIQQKIAEAAATSALQKYAGIKELAAKAKGHGAAALAKAKAHGSSALEKVKGYHKGLAADARVARTGVAPMTGAHGGKRDLHVSHGDRARAAGKTVLKSMPHVAVAGAVTEGGRRLLKKKEE